MIWRFLRAGLVSPALVLLVVYGAAIVVAGSPLHETPAMAQTEGAVPGGTQGNVSDAEIWRQVRWGGSGTVSIPDKKLAVLVQSAGDEWRNLRNGPLYSYGAWSLLGIIVVVAAFFAVRGRVMIDDGESGRSVLRFTSVEVFVHWLTASSFIVLALTGLNMLYGKHVLLPLIGNDAFAVVTRWGKYAHDSIAFAFIAGIVLMAVLWLKDNLPDRYDAGWLARGGGLLTTNRHPPAGRFNTGQKLIFWLVVGGGGLSAFTGINLLLPFFWLDLEGMHLMHVLHAVAGLALIVMSIAHAYIGSVGMEGAFDAMGTGHVDANWLRQHHSAWFAELEGEDETLAAGAAYQSSSSARKTS